MSTPAHNKILAILFSVLSLLFSFGCLLYGITVFTNPDVAQRIKVFAYAVAGYGVVNVYILSTAWRVRSSWCPGASKAIGICLFGVMVMDRLASGIQNATEVAGLVIVGCLLWICWQAVQNAVERDEKPAPPKKRKK